MDPLKFNLVLIIITVVVSMLAWQNQSLLRKLVLWPYQMHGPNEYYRLITNGFVHADTIHLVFNMFTLFFVGSFVEEIFRAITHNWVYPFFYLSAILVSAIPTFLQKRKQPNYISLGASGGVSAVLFSMIQFAPWQTIYVWFIPLYSIFFAVLYLAYSIYMNKKGGDNINHSAHLYGAIYGLLFSFIVDPTHGQGFLQEIMNPPFLH